MDYLRSKGLIDLFAVGGNGGSLAQKYWSIIPFPNFPDNVCEEIVRLYHHPIEDDHTTTIGDFQEKDNCFNSYAGIFELDKSLKRLKDKLAHAINDIANDIEVHFTFF